MYEYCGTRVALRHGLHQCGAKARSADMGGACIGTEQAREAGSHLLRVRPSWGEPLCDHRDQGHGVPETPYFVLERRCEAVHVGVGAQHALEGRDSVRDGVGRSDVGGRERHSSELTQHSIADAE